MTLKDIKIGDSAIIEKIYGTDLLRLRLLDMGFIPQTIIKVKKVAPLGDPIWVQIRGYEISIRKDDAKRIQVKKE